MSEEDQPATEPAEDEEEEGETQSTQSRHWLTNDAAALTLVLAMTGIVTAGVLLGFSIPATVVQAYVAGFLVAVVWLFGRGAAGYILGKNK